MDFFDKKIKAIFSSEDTNEIPNGFEWDDMQNGIYEKMPKKKRRVFPFYLLIMAGLVVISGGVYLNYYFKNNTHINQQSAEINNHTADFNKIVEQEYKHEIVSKDDESIIPKIEESKHGKDNNVQNLKASKTALKNSSSANSYYSKTNIKVVDSGTKTLSFSDDSPRVNKQIILNNTLKTSTNLLDSINSDLEALQISSSPILLNPTNTTNKSNIFINSAQNISSEAEIKMVLPLLALDFLANKEVILPLNNMVITNVNQANEVIKDKKSVSYFLSPSVTCGTWNWGTNSSISDFEKTQLFMKNELNFGYKISKRFWISSGLHFNSFNSKFENIFLEESIRPADSTEVINFLTNESHFEAGGEETLIRHRHVIHYNVYNSIELPLQVHFQLTKNKWAFTSGIGGSASIFSWNSGKSMDHEGNLINYSSASNLKTFKGYSILVNSRIGYFVSKKQEISLGVNFQQSMSNWMNLEEQSRRPFAYGIGLGYNMYF